MSETAFPQNDPLARALERLDAARAAMQQRAAEPLPAAPRTRQDVTQDLDIDRRRGAPASVRAAVGAAPSEADRLATLRGTYPDAQPHGDGNFVFTDPQTGRRTLYNPPGFDWADIASIAPEIGELGGGMVGGGLAALSAAPTGGMGVFAVPAGVGLGAAAGREIATSAARLFNGTRDTRTLPARVGDAAITAGINAAAGPAAEAGLAAGRGILGSASRGFGRRTGDAALSDFAARNVPPTLGTATGNPTVQVIERGIGATPGGAQPMVRAHEAQSEALGAAVRRQATDLSGGADPATRGSTGGQLRGGMETAATRFRARQEGLYDEAYNRIGAEVPVPVPAVSALRQQVTDELAQAPASRARTLAPIVGRLDALLADAGEGGVPFGALRAVRTDLGRELHAPVTAASAPASNQMPYLDRLYGALSDDMGAAARAAGPEAERALSLADRYTRFNATQNVPAIERILATKTDEAAYNAVFPASGRPDAQVLNRVLRNLTPADRRALAATVLDRMGMPTPGVAAGETFSPATFLTNWNRLTQGNPEARRALFGSDRELASGLDRLARVAGSIRDASRGTNWSNTAAVATAGGAALSAMGDIGEGDAGGLMRTIGVTLVAPYVAARLLTSPAFVRWAARSAEDAAGGALPESAVTALARVGVLNPQIRREVEQLQMALRAAPSRPPPAPMPTR